MNNSFGLVLEILTKFIGKRGAKIVICLVMMSLDMKNADIKDRFGASWDTLRKYRAAFDAGNVAPLFEMKAERKQSELASHEGEIMADFEVNPPKTLWESRERIIALTGITRSLHRIRVFLLKRGLNPGHLVSVRQKQIQ